MTHYSDLRDDTAAKQRRIYQRCRDNRKRCDAIARACKAVVQFDSIELSEGTEDGNKQERQARRR